MYEIDIDVFARENENGENWTWVYNKERFDIDVPVNDTTMPRNENNVADYDTVNDAAIEVAKNAAELIEMFTQFFRDLKEKADKSSSMNYIITFSIKEKGGWSDELNTATMMLRYGRCLNYNTCLEPFPTVGKATAILAVVKAIKAAYNKAVA